MSKFQLSLLHIFMAEPAHSYMLYFQHLQNCWFFCLPKRCTLVDNPIHVKETNQCFHIGLHVTSWILLNLSVFIGYLKHSAKNHPHLQLWIETIGLKSHINNCLFDPLWANEVWILQKPVLLSNLFVSVSINSNDCMANLKIFILTCWRTVWNGITTTVSTVFL